MENIDDNTSSSGIDSLFIQEDDEKSNKAVNESSTVEKGPEHFKHTMMGPFMAQTRSIGPYLKEMDDLLKRCEELTGMTECTFQRESDKNEDGITHKRYSSQEYMSIKCTDTYMDRSHDKTSCGVSIDDCSSLPLTSAGKKLSQSMEDYEDQLLNMMTMMGSSIEGSAMDQEAQNWTTNEEYVHIPKLFKETVKTLLEPGEAMILEAQTAAMNFCDNQDNIGDEVHVRKRAIRGITQNVFNSDNASIFSLTVPKRCKETDFCEDFITDQQMPQLEFTEHNPLMCEDACAEEEHCKNMGTDNTVLHAETKVDMTCPSSTAIDLETLRSKLDKCIDEVQCLEQRRKELLAEALKLSGHQQETNEQDEDMNQIDSKVLQLIRTLKKNEDLKRESEIESLRQERAEEERKVWRVSVETQGLQNQRWKLKRELFTVARECAQNQAALRAQHQYVELIKKEQEELQTEAVKLSEDSNNLQMNHQQELLRLQEQLNAATSNQMINTQEGLSQSRKDSCGGIQQYLQDSLKALEDRYGPILIALLKRRDTAVDACAKVKGQAQDLRVQLTPLKDVVQQLELQKACLEEKLKLIHFQRKEDIGQYRETVNSLEESCRELNTELKMQKKKTKEMEELKESLSKQLTIYRSAIETCVTCDETS